MTLSTLKVYKIILDQNDNPSGRDKGKRHYAENNGVMGMVHVEKDKYQETNQQCFILLLANKRRQL